MHFFNPAHIMKLVEIIAGEKTDEETLLTIHQLCVALSKQPVFCKDAPGFIVNRVARHYYLEAMQIAESTGMDIKDLDALMVNQGFKMGPFALMDLIGLDVNYAVSTSVYESFNKNIRFKPAPMQAAKVKQGHLGKKTGKGFYEYN
jgi:3-hydroxybutyryl-CoA dehydrogenase